MQEQHYEYQVWILGYNEDYSVNDWEQLEGRFEEREKAEWFALHYDFCKPVGTPRAEVVVEEVLIAENGDEECLGVLLESEL